MSTAKFLQMLAHPIAQDAVQSLARGAHPKGVLAGIAGDLVAQEVAKALGARKAVRPAKASTAPGVKHRPKVEVVSEDDVVDADYTVIDVTPRGAKKAG